MPQVGNFSPAMPTHMTPIICPACGSSAAHMKRRSEAVTGDGKGEIRVFECSDCKALTEMFVSH
jgi:hypothetical protein